MRMRFYRPVLGGVLLALNMLVLFAAAVLPGLELSLYAVSSFFTAVVVLKGKEGPEARGRPSPHSGAVFYVASVLLGFAVVPDKTALAPYVLFFGYYGIAKYYIEQLRRQWLEIPLKCALFAAAAALGILLWKKGFASGITLPQLPAAALAAGAIAGFLIYDYTYTLILAAFRKRLPI